jgi:hypothetical protein
MGYTKTSLNTKRRIFLSLPKEHGRAAEESIGKAAVVCGPYERRRKKDKSNVNERSCS